MSVCTPRPSLLIVGASRGLGAAVATEFLRRDWDVVGTVRSPATPLHELAAAHPGRVTVERLDLDDPAEIAGLHERLAGRSFDMLFVNAGTTTRDEHVRIGEVSTEEFNRVLMTNTLGPMRVIETMQDLVAADGLIGAMSSGQGSVANNESGLRDVYRASKAALNMCMRSFAAREAGSKRAMVLMAPGWIRTELGGPDAPFSLAETVPLIADVLLAARSVPGLRYLDRFGKVVPW